MRLTDEQIRETVRRMKLPDEHVNALLRQAIDENDASARAVLAAKARRLGVLPSVRRVDPYTGYAYAGRP